MSNMRIISSTMNIIFLVFWVMWSFDTKASPERWEDRVRICFFMNGWNIYILLYEFIK